MNHNAPLTPRAPQLPHLRGAGDVRLRVLSAAQLRVRGVTAAETNARCRPGGVWQQYLPGVYLLHQGPPTSEERLHAALLYAGRPVARGGVPGALTRGKVPVQPAAQEPPEQPEHGEQHGGGALPYGEPAPYRDALVTGAAALALYGFRGVAALPALDRFDVLVPRTRRLRSTPSVRLVRTAALPTAQMVDGVPVAPVARAVADAVAQLTDGGAVRTLLTEAVRDGHCEPASLVRELTQARLLSRPYVVDAVDALLAEGRSVAEDRLYRMVAEYGLPEPVWNVDLRIPDGPYLGAVDAFWPEHAVAVELDTRAPRPGGRQDGAAEQAEWAEYARRRDHLERLGITVVHVTPRKLRDGLEQQATVVRVALTAAGDREPAAYVAVLPR
ncbi:hypothetical protein [Streptomyces uncialis]|uniref:hypothetical protein n=1 Tax=Streptomyces uncialis TaxID=1048205 RepID=UPI0033D03E1B